MRSLVRDMAQLEEDNEGLVDVDPAEALSDDMVLVIFLHLLVVQELLHKEMMVDKV